jgi:hypothetical protein
MIKGSQTLEKRGQSELKIVNLTINNVKMVICIYFIDVKSDNF